MKNRISENPGRVLITPEDGSAPFYATMTRADNPTQEGDPLCKDTLLKDATAALYGLDTTAVPDHVFALLKTLVSNAQLSADIRSKIETGSYTGVGSSTKTLTFSFQPKILIVAGQAISANEIRGIGIFPCVAYDTTRRKLSFLTATISNMTTGGDYNYAYLSSDGKTITWSANGVEYALNSANYQYFYVALG